MTDRNRKHCGSCFFVPLGVAKVLKKTKVIRKDDNILPEFFAGFYLLYYLQFKRQGTVISNCLMSTFLLSYFLTIAVRKQAFCNALAWCVQLLCHLPDVAMSSVRHDC